MFYSIQYTGERSQLLSDFTEFDTQERGISPVQNMQSLVHRRERSAIVRHIQSSAHRRKKYQLSSEKLDSDRPEYSGTGSTNLWVNKKQKLL